MRESDLSGPVCEWLRREGYEVYVEVFDVDIVARRGDHLVAVELKMRLNRRLFEQLTHAAWWADEVYGAIPAAGTRRSKRKRVLRSISTDSLKHQGFGLLSVSGDVCRQVIGAREQPWARVKTRRYRFTKLARRVPAAEDDVGGLPCCSALAEQNSRQIARAALRSHPVTPSPRHPVTSSPR